MLDAATIERDLAFAIESAKEAGARGLAVRALAEKKGWEGKILGDVCDQACDGYLHGFLTGRYADDGILSEETIDTPERLGKSRVWIVDPLDGTKEYAQLRDDWAVHVALTVDGECTLGAVALPSLDRIYYGVSQDGVRRAGVIGPERPEDSVQNEVVHGDSASPAAPRIAVSRSHTPEWVERFASAMGGTLAPAGSAGNKVAMLLAGDADMYVHKIGLKEWDTCAPEAIALSAGWHVCRLDGTPHVYNQRDPKNHELVVCRPSVKDGVLAALREAGALEDRLVQ